MTWLEIWLDIMVGDLVGDAVFILKSLLWHMDLFDLLAKSAMDVEIIIFGGWAFGIITRLSRCG